MWALKLDNLSQIMPLTLTRVSKLCDLEGLSWVSMSMK